MRKFFSVKSPRIFSVESAKNLLHQKCEKSSSSKVRKSPLKKNVQKCANQAKCFPNCPAVKNRPKKKCRLIKGRTAGKIQITLSQPDRNTSKIARPTEKTQHNIGILILHIYNSRKLAEYNSATRAKNPAASPAVHSRPQSGRKKQRKRNNEIAHSCGARLFRTFATFAFLRRRLFCINQNGGPRPASKAIPSFVSRPERPKKSSRTLP